VAFGLQHGVIFLMRFVNSSRRRWAGVTISRDVDRSLILELYFINFAVTLRAASRAVFCANNKYGLLFTSNQILMSASNRM
jgi:hypothetical protein